MVDVPAHQFQETVEVSMAMLQERTSERIAEQIADVSEPKEIMRAVQNKHTRRVWGNRWWTCPFASFRRRGSHDSCAFHATRAWDADRGRARHHVFSSAAAFVPATWVAPWPTAQAASSFLGLLRLRMQLPLPHSLVAIAPHS